MTTKKNFKTAAPRLQNLYNKEIVPALMKQLDSQGNKVNAMQVPRLTKITVSMGLGEAQSNPKIADEAVETLGKITGQKAVTTKARKSIATFKLRQGSVVGAMVTLRGRRMWEFLDRFINVALPRVRDFRGLAKSFDGKGNFACGIKEVIIFPEVEDKLDKIRGMNICMVTTASEDAAGMKLFEQLGVPFTKNV